MAAAEWPPPPRRVAFAGGSVSFGRSHDARWLDSTLEQCAAMGCDTVVLAGSLARRHTERLHTAVSQTLAEHGLQMWLTGGPRDGASLPGLQSGDVPAPTQLAPRLVYAPAGARWRWGETTLLSMGSLGDGFFEYTGVAPSERMRVRMESARAGGLVDVMVSYVEPDSDSSSGSETERVNSAVLDVLQEELLPRLTVCVSASPDYGSTSLWQRGGSHGLVHLLSDDGSSTRNLLVYDMRELDAMSARDSEVGRTADYAASQLHLELWGSPNRVHALVATSGSGLADSDSTAVDTVYNLHHRNACLDGPCSLHRPSEHELRGLDRVWEAGKRRFSRVCAHGRAHPDPDQIGFWLLRDAESQLQHPCDGCCPGGPSGAGWLVWHPALRWAPPE